MTAVQFLTLDDVNLRDQRVLVRVDFNVPLRDGQIADDTRIRATLPTIRRLQQENAAITLMSHLWRPKPGAKDPGFSLAPVAKHLSTLLKEPVKLYADWPAPGDVQPGQIALLENVRFLQGETKNDEGLARRMAALCDVFVNDAFATAHRAQASTYGVAKYAPVACAGPLLVQEVEALSHVLENPARPMAAVVGGAKISTKLTVLRNLCARVDLLITGGGILNTFMKAAGLPIGKSLHEPDLVQTAAELAQMLESKGSPLVLPVDVVCATEFSENASAMVRAADAVGGNEMIMDVGPETAAAYAARLKDAGTILWNGPLGVFEFPAFANGTRTLAEAIAASPAFSVAGGGDTLAAIAAFGVQHRISYVSTGGGAFLEYMEGATLPAIAILEEAVRARRAAESEY